MDELRHHVDTVYNCTFVIPGGRDIGFDDVLNGVETEVHVHVKASPVAEVPASDAATSEYCIQRYAEIDDVLEHHKQHGVFPGVDRAYDRM